MPTPRSARRAPPKPAPPSKWKNVLVLGGSYGGARAARVLAEGLPDGWRVLLVEKQSHFNHLYVFPRYTVVQGHEHKAFIPYAELNPPASPSSQAKAKPAPKPAPKAYPEGDDYYPASDIHFPPPSHPPPTGPHRILHASVLALHPAHATLSRPFPEHGLPAKEVPYEYLVYALGSTMPPPLLMPPDALYKLGGVAWMIDQGARIRRASRVVVVGGGALGIQYASDIKDHYPSTSVTLLHSRPRLLPRFDERMHPLIRARLEALGVQLILGDRLVDEHVREGKVHTLKGRVIDCDYLMLCTGQSPNTAILADSFAASSLNPLTGHVTVLRTMQVCPYDLPSLNSGSGSPSTPTPTPTPGHLDSARQGERPPLRLPPPRHTPYPHLFAIGDCADAFGAIKAGHTAYYQAELAARNILLLISHSHSHSHSTANALANALASGPRSGSEEKHPNLNMNLTLEQKLEEYSPGRPAIKLTVGVQEAVVLDGEGRVELVECEEDLSAEGMWKAMGVGGRDMWE
ncbi:FAD/NAD(P)-binding domain-containing protein [Calocera cornea HHB12733]|uniref:FAD/NAD(P)-binding domain-containing protein n=1 Tax=Calocera cornea HHB12733 TaxID=1353952 RepID=A0A165CRP5_9BASI|nr:FAD/NAD(P)-binding domain-containing protein [Calocera cornea HHB12733]